jgi:regulator of sigma E protease
LGGFVKIKGENGDTKTNDSFASKPAWQRSIVLSAGVLMNIALAWVIITIGLMFGLPQVLDNLPAGTKVTGHQIQIVDVLPDSPASKADFKIGDFIADINGQKFNTYKEVQDFVDKNNGKALTYTVKRGQEMIDKQVTPVTMKETNRGGIGIGIAEIGLVRYPFFTAIAKGFTTTFGLLWVIILGFIGLLGRLFTGQNVSAEVAGPVGIATLTGQMVDMGWVYLMQFVALLSLNLAIINILPIPALDGGRLIFLLWEKLRGKPVKQTTEAMIHNIFFILLLALILLVTYKDIAKLGCLTCRLRQIINL